MYYVEFTEIVLFWRYGVIFLPWWLAIRVFLDKTHTHTHTHTLMVLDTITNGLVYINCLLKVPTKLEQLSLTVMDSRPDSFLLTHWPWHQHVICPDCWPNCTWHAWPVLVHIHTVHILVVNPAHVDLSLASWLPILPALMYLGNWLFNALRVLHYSAMRFYNVQKM